MNRLARLGLVCGLLLLPTARAADIAISDSNSSGGPVATLWIMTKTTFGYDSRYLRYPDMASCQQALAQQQEPATPGTERWCAATPAR